LGLIADVPVEQPLLGANIPKFDQFPSRGARGKLSRRFKKPDNRSPTMAALAARKPFIQTGTGSLAFDLLIRINATRGVRIIITIS